MEYVYEFWLFCIGGVRFVNSELLHLFPSCEDNKPSISPFFWNLGYKVARVAVKCN